LVEEAKIADKRSIGTFRALCGAVENPFMNNPQGVPTGRDSTSGFLFYPRIVLTGQEISIPLL
jgi:hypothetical protein